jgi:foldase protein PrsA
MEEAVENAAFNLETDEISEIVEGDTGYHIFKCISTFDREETDANKLVIVEKRKDEVFGQKYDTFVNTLVKNLNEKLWDEITLVHDENVDTSDFFEIYDRYFGQDAS